jgi:hypothetical protein
MRIYGLPHLALLALFVVPQNTFTRFTYCRDTVRGVYESQCAFLTPDGAGEVRLKRRGLDEVQIPVALSSSGIKQLHSVIAATDYLADSSNYETKRRVADLGLKRLTLETDSGKREARFNYSDLKEVVALATFFDALLNQQAVVFDLETAMRYERLTVPEKLDLVENELRANRIADPHALIPVLEKVERDTRILQYARERAVEIKNRIAAARR